MPFIFKNSPDHIEFEYCDTLPDHVIGLGTAGKLNLTAFHLYGLYRNSLYDSYAEKRDKKGGEEKVAPDILERKMEYHESKASLLKDPVQKEPLYHYTVATAIGATQEWQDPQKQMRGFLAYEWIKDVRTLIGFVDFNERLIDGQKVIYISTAAVLRRGEHIGRRLMELVLAHFPPGTTFYILTRVFNTEAKNLYGERLKFSPIGPDEIRQLDYSPERYCGYKHKSTPEEIAAIKLTRVTTGKPPVRFTFSRERVAAELEAKVQLAEKRKKQARQIRQGLFFSAAFLATALTLRRLTDRTPAATGTAPSLKSAP